MNEIGLSVANTQTKGLSDNQNPTVTGSNQSISTQPGLSGQTTAEQLVGQATPLERALGINNQAKVGLSEVDFQRAANTLGVDVATIKAVAEVEARGNGFLKSGDPKILFEAHIFSKLTHHKFDGAHPDISSRTWNRKLYLGGQAEHDRLSRAMKLDPDAALQSASWGRFQIMGFNYQRAGYDSPQAFVNDMRKSEANHLHAFVKFIASDPVMLEALQQKDWKTFARRYNGPAYQQNNYDTKIAEAYLRHRTH